MLAGVIYQYRKKAILLIVLTAALVATTDQVSRSFKYSIERYRPCRPESNHLPKPHVIKEHCGGKFGFFSAHASNTFGIAIFFGSLLIPLVKHSKYILLIWAAIVAYSRIHLGVHYPIDIVCGALCGILFGWIYTKIAFKYLKYKA
jgi:undecaprenyl-diphosphatase